jgi:hypothetical protein
VSGKVTMQGAPIEGVAVSFIPDGNGHNAVGVTDNSGMFQLTTRIKNDGAVPGKYRVSLAKYEGEQTVTDPSKMHADYDITNEYPEGYQEGAAEKPPAKNLLPVNYADPNTSGMSAEVLDGDNKSFEFEIK